MVIYMCNLFLVFVATIVVDWIWAAYIIHTSKKNTLKASILATLITCIGSFVTLSFIEDHRAIIAAGAGAFVGTFLSIKFNKIKEQNV
jgi:hypothetical protein